MHTAHRAVTVDSLGSIHRQERDWNLTPCLFAFLPGIPSSAGNSLDCLQDDNPPHWLKSLQALTEMDAPASTAAPPQQQQQQQQPQHHTGMLDMHLSSLHRAGWAPYLPPPSTATPSHFHSPPPGFQTAFRPPAQTATADLLQNAAMDRH